MQSAAPDAQPSDPAQNPHRGCESFGVIPACTQLPELLAPAGDWECAKAAVENGADAIYFGLERFNARMRARNFTEADLPRLMEFLHRRGVKGYVTFNTLVFTNELTEAVQYLKAIISAGVDAAIVQDVGICRLIRRISPDFPIHASTQMTITSAAGVEFAKELGCSLVVLARECSLKEIERIQSSLSGDSQGTSRNSPLPLEVFVHGALCVAYSGQCLTSEVLGGRSANRGECAQACRMPYELISDGQVVPLGDRRYLLSPQDLAGLEILPDLVRTGVASLKIEGRLKTPEYVANITRIYRRALDEITNLQPLQNASRYDLEMAFSRGLHTGWFRGINNQALVHARFGKKRGVYLGEVKRIEREAILLELRAPLKPGDGIVLDAGHPEQKEEGGRVFSVETSGHETRMTFRRGQLDFSRIGVGDKLWKTSDPDLDRRLRGTFSGNRPRFQQPLQLEVYGEAGEPMTLLARDERGHVVSVRSRLPLQTAVKQPLTSKRLDEQFGRLGGTPFALREIKNNLTGSVLLPLSELNWMRRQVVHELETLRSRPLRWTLNEAALSALSGCRVVDLSSPTVQRAAPGDTIESLRPINLVVLVRNLAQVEAALRCGQRTIYCEFEDPKKYRDAVAMVRGYVPPSACQESDPTPSIFVAPPRIFKPGEDWILKQVRACEADGYLVRNYDHLTHFQDGPRIGDFSLNVANPWTADYFINRFGLQRVTASYDLNFQQLEAMLQSAPPEWFEVTVHQHIPMFHMEHCVFCAFLSTGTDYTNCGRPCDRHQVKLRDRVGAEHPLLADIGCRNTVFNALAQTGAEHVSQMLKLGVRYFRLEFLNETPEQVTQTIAKYRQLLRGEISGAQLWRELKLLSQLGVTRGQF